MSKINCGYQKGKLTDLVPASNLLPHIWSSNWP